MKLDPREWLEAAQLLPVGAKAAIQHSCGDGDKLLVEHKAKGWSAWCYRCSLDGWVPHPAETTAEKIARLKAVRVVEETLQRDTRPPTPAVFDAGLWPDEHRLWLYRAGIGKRLIEKHGIYYHERSDRVVIPVIRDGKLVYWQARSQDKSRPKYLNPSVDKPIYKVGEGPTLVLTEDILSAIKVGQVTAAWSILGTSVTDSIVKEVMRVGSPVAIWLDPDGAGIKGARKLRRELAPLVTQDVRVIVSDRDPKLHSRKEILVKLGFDPTEGA